MDSPSAISKIFQSCLNHPISKLSKSLEKKINQPWKNYSASNKKCMSLEFVAGVSNS